MDVTCSFVVAIRVMTDSRNSQRISDGILSVFGESEREGLVKLINKRYQKLQHEKTSKLAIEVQMCSITSSVRPVEVAIDVDGNVDRCVSSACARASGARHAPLSMPDAAASRWARLTVLSGVGSADMCALPTLRAGKRRPSRQSQSCRRKKGSPACGCADRVRGTGQSVTSSTAWIRSCA